MRVLAGANTNRITPAPDRLTLVNGRPETIALKYSTGKRVQSRFGGEQTMYTLADGRRAYFPVEVGAEIDALHLAPGQPFSICKLGPQAWDVQYAHYPTRAATPPAAQQQQPSAPAARPAQPDGPPHPWPEEMDAPPTRRNGAGEDVPAILARMYPPAIEIALGAVEAARGRGLMISPTFEDIRTIATALFIAETGGRNR